MFSPLTIVAIDGRPGNSLGSQRAIQRSAQQLPGAKQLFISADRPTELIDGIFHRLVQPLSYFEYSLFVLYGLHAFIDTPFALIVQDDGWVLDGKNWREEFWGYDYIGAPIHAAAVTEGTKRSYLRNFEWARYLTLPFPATSIDFVQNGGFSLRSKRFLETFSKHQLPYQIPAPQQIFDEQGALHLNWPHDDLQEDVYCCVHARSTLEKLGIKFAPLDVSKYFSYEHLGPGINDSIDLTKVLGHHSKYRKLMSCNPYEVKYSLSELETDRLWGEHRVIDALRRQGVGIDFS